MHTQPQRTRRVDGGKLASDNFDVNYNDWWITGHALKKVVHNVVWAGHFLRTSAEGQPACTQVPLYYLSSDLWREVMEHTAPAASRAVV
mmetsp:Transcript_25913/g.51090  ORF Transcript_25913/g.51090 Transcript_25913/m.51090 type:complete len:89 (+) Transcript_25913:64-330(+)